MTCVSANINTFVCTRDPWVKHAYAYVLVACEIYTYSLYFVWSLYYVPGICKHTERAARRPLTMKLMGFDKQLPFYVFQRADGMT